MGPAALAELAERRLRSKIPQLTEALTGRSPHTVLSRASAKSLIRS